MMLRCEHLTKAFGGVEAVSDVSLALPAAAMIGIIGPNGAGKTTLLNVLTGFLPPDRGRCFIGGMETTNAPAHEIAQLGVARTFQDLRLVRGVSALENVLLADPTRVGEGVVRSMIESRRARRQAEDRAMNVLDRVGLSEKATSVARELSWGEQKLLTIACCVATQASILLLDEPVAGVSPVMMERITLLIRELRREDRLIVFIEHDMETVSALAETVVVLDEGKVIAVGPTNDVMGLPEIAEAYLA